MASGDIKFEVGPIGLESESDSISGEKFVMTKTVGSSGVVKVTVEYPNGLGVTSSTDGPLDFDHSYTLKIIEN